MKLLSLVACFLLLAATAFAAANPPVQGLIWRATSKASMIYLIGSVHVGDKSMYPLPPIYDLALEQASVLVEEVKDIDDANTMAPLMQKYAMYPAGDSLAKHLKPETLKRLIEFCNANSMPWDTFRRLRPWVVSVIIPVLPQMKAASQGGTGTPVPGIDQYFASKARAEHKPIVGVETAEFQVKLLMSLSGSDQDRAINAALTTGAGPKNQVVDIIADWVKGDAQDLAKESSGANFPRALLEDRNHRMADAAETYLKSGKTCLFIVGTLHLLGKEGIVQLLKDKGYTVVQILSGK